MIWKLLSSANLANFFLHHFSFSKCILLQVDETSNLSAEISVNTWPHLPQNKIWAKILNNTFCSSPPPKNPLLSDIFDIFSNQKKPPCFHLSTPTPPGVLKQQIQGAQQEHHPPPLERFLRSNRSDLRCSPTSLDFHVVHLLNFYQAAGRNLVLMMKNGDFLVTLLVGKHPIIQ